MNLTKRNYNSITPVENGNRRHQTATLSVINVDYIVREWVGPWWRGACFRKRQEKKVLHEVSLQLKSGEITAILGNSGSGKTSLLDVISCRTSGDVFGHVYYNNVERTPDLIQQRATYVMQADRLLPNLTVRETLIYTARLKLPGNTKDSKIKTKVTQVIMEMGLKDVADSRIGGSVIRGISGGEQRRVTIAIQLLKDPDIILLDEPTSGLDSYTARYLVSNLRDLSRRGKIVLLTIHQPSSDIFGMFDQTGIMSGGEIVYIGPGRTMINYFTELGYPCDRYTNPLDKYVDVASIDRRDRRRESESKERVRKLVESFKSSELYNTTQDSMMCNTLSRSMEYADVYRYSKRPSYGRVFTTLLSRMTKNLFRDRKDYVARIFLLPLFFVFILIFLGRLKHTQTSVQDRIGLLYQSSTVPPFMGIINSVALFPNLRDLYYRENRDGLYGTFTFLLAYSIHILPFHIVSCIIFSSVTYWVTGMNPYTERFGLYILCIFILHYWGEIVSVMCMGVLFNSNFANNLATLLATASVVISSGYLKATGMNPYAERFGLYTVCIFILHYWGEIVSVMCMGIFMNCNLANSVAALLQAASVVISSGYLKDLKSIIKPFQWLSWALIHKYCGEIFIALEFKDLELECDTNSTDPCLWPTGDIYLDTFFPDADKHMARNFGVMAAYALGTLVLATIVYNLFKKRDLH